MSLRTIVRNYVLKIEKTGPAEAIADVETIRKKLQELGLDKNCHVGNNNLNEQETIQWYAGQILDIVDSQSWFAMNSIINRLDKFCPER